jgi:hypothetical protein
VSKEVRCLPCNALLQTYHSSYPQGNPASNKTIAYDTVGNSEADHGRHFSEPIGRHQKSALRDVELIKEDNRTDTIERPAKHATAAQLPHAAEMILQGCMPQHLDPPYPKNEAKEFLRQETGLSVGHISNWMADTKQRRKRKFKQAVLPCGTPCTTSGNYPISGFSRSCYSMVSAFERSFFALSQEEIKVQSLHAGGKGSTVELF